MTEPAIPPRRRTLLVILDGFGVNPSKRFNAVLEARTPRLDDYFSRYPHTVLQASGAAVGLPDGQMGNSEVGHIILGCGAIMRQDLVRIDEAIENGSFFANPALNDAIDRARQADRPVHLLGLVSDGGVHSHIWHLLALIELCRQRGARALVHMITDGRDTAPECAQHYLPRLEKRLTRAGGAIATVIGRYHAMDRDHRWDRTEQAWQALVNLQGKRATNAEAAIEASHAAGIGDEFILPTVLPEAEPIQPGDQVIFFNFRNDRPRQLIRALALDEFDGFDRGDYRSAAVSTMTQYDPDYDCPVAFPPERSVTSLGRIVSEAGLAQFRCAETEKYPHVTFFFNGGRERAFKGERRKMVPSPKVATYDLQPEMSAEAVADATIEALASREPAFAVVNFANGDMVGHTGVREAIVKAVETLDTQAGRVLDAAVQNDYSVLLTADHGNCDEMVDPFTGGPQTAHSVYPVPCLIIDKVRWKLATGGGLSNVAPTLLQIMGLPKPQEMTGSSVLLEMIEIADG